jgi:hypothetical protein
VVAPIRTSPVLVWRVSADSPGYFGGDRQYTHVWLSVLDDLLLVQAQRYVHEYYGGWWEGPYESRLSVHDAATGLRLWGMPGEPVATTGDTITLADGRQDRTFARRTGALAHEVDRRRSPGPSAGMPPPVRMARAGDVVYTVVPGNVLVARDTAAERTLWQLAFEARIAALAPAPERLYVLVDGGHLTLFGS